jgi:hypothetical protein
MVEAPIPSESPEPTGSGARTVRYALADPAEFGVDPAKLDELRVRAHREIGDGVLPSCQLALARHGRLLLFETIGAAARQPVRHLLDDQGRHRGAIWLLVSDGLWPGTTGSPTSSPSSAPGKDVITVEQPPHERVPTAPLADPGPTSAGRCERFAQWRLNWNPARFEYHPTSALGAG